MKKILFAIALSLLCSHSAHALGAKESKPVIEKISRGYLSKFLATQAIHATPITLPETSKASVAALKAKKDNDQWQIWFYWCDEKETADGCLDIQYRRELKGEWASDFVHTWNSEKRFGRVYETHDGVGLVSDINIEGGVTPEYLNVMTRVWFEMVGLVKKEDVNYIAPPAEESQ